MKHILYALTIALTIGALAFPAGAEETGRTDDTEESEFGKGGYPYGGALGRLYLITGFGSGFFDQQSGNAQTGFLYSLDVGYEMDQWIGIQAGYTYLSDRKLSIFSLGSRFSYTWEPFVYHISLTSGMYAPETGSSHFGLAPGAGIDIIVHDRVRLGLDYKHDFIFTDNETTDIDRVNVGLKFFF
ncbi:MAG: hypothetical protein O7G87_10175 [bacterium]|nr:hypothetical protein [bacterium]